VDGHAAISCSCGNTDEEMGNRERDTKKGWRVHHHFAVTRFPSLAFKTTFMSRRPMGASRPPLSIADTPRGAGLYNHA